MQFQLVENTTTLGGKVKPLTIERIFPPNDKMVTYQKGMDKSKSNDGRKNSFQKKLKAECYFRTKSTFCQWWLLLV
jgi:hypothetical protein